LLGSYVLLDKKSRTTNTRVIIISTMTMSFWLDFPYIDNQAKYKHFIIGLEIFLELGEAYIKLEEIYFLLLTSYLVNIDLNTLP